MSIQHVIPLGDLLPHRDDDCPCNPRIEGDLVIHNSWDGREMNEVGVDWCRPKIQVYKDGDQWCALAGENIQSGYAGFGSTPHEALRRLLSGWAE